VLRGSYKLDKKANSARWDALVEKKLIKRGAKDKADAKHPYSLTNLGKKHPGSRVPRVHDWSSASA